MSNLRQEIIPEDIRHLLPYAVRWGINCDVRRGEYFDSQPIADVINFADTYAPWADRVNAWLDTFPIEAKWPSEALAYLFLNKAYCDAYAIAQNYRKSNHASVATSETAMGAVSSSHQG